MVRNDLVVTHDVGATRAPESPRSTSFNSRNVCSSLPNGCPNAFNAGGFGRPAESHRVLVRGRAPIATAR